QMHVSVFLDVCSQLEDIQKMEVDFGEIARFDKEIERLHKEQVRFLLGSTAKMGAGTNVQDRLIALHHLDVPWRPSDIE
ncbi:hypothetical protein, partial [Staphylococcus aureus]